MSVLVGSVHRKIETNIAGIQAIHVHPDYDVYKHDIAIIELRGKLTFSREVQPIELATEEVPDGSDVIVSGWGTEIPNVKEATMLLKYNTLKALATSKCSALNDNIFNDQILCLGHEANNGVCHGDSGGPAVYNGKLVGVAGFVYPTSCGTNNPDGFAKVSVHIEWIKSIIEN